MPTFSTKSKPMEIFTVSIQFCIAYVPKWLMLHLNCSINIMLIGILSTLKLPISLVCGKNAIDFVRFISILYLYMLILVLSISLL